MIKHFKIERRFELSMMLQRLRDEKARSKISVADYIESNISKKPLFNTRQDMAKPLLWYVIRPLLTQLCEAIGERPGIIDDSEYHDPGIGGLETPIHPGIRSFFGLPGDPTSHKYRINKTRLAFREYCHDYMTATFQKEIYEGVFALNKKAFPEAIAFLQRGLQTCPTSAEGCHELARSYIALNDYGAATQFAAASTLLDPDN